MRLRASRLNSIRNRPAGLLAQNFLQSWADANGGFVAAFEDDSLLIVDPVTPSNNYYGSARNFWRTRSFTNFTGTPKLTLQANGNISYQRHNLLAMSQRFDSPYWVKGTSGGGSQTVGSSTNVAPDGSSTATLVTIDRAATTGSVLIRCTTGAPTLTAQPYSRSVYVKAFAAGDIGKKIDLWYWNGTAVVTNTVITLTADWQRVTDTITGVTSGSQEAFSIGYLTSSVTGVTRGDQTGQTQYLVWGAQVNLGPTALEYVRTDTHNLVLQSEAINNAAWTNVGTVSVTADNTTAPDGTTTADLINVTALTVGEGGRRSTAISLLSGVTYCQSCYVKPGTITSFRLGFFDGTNFGTRDFTFSSKTFGNSQGTLTRVNEGYEELTNGWFRVWAAFTASAAGTQGINFITTATGTFHLWGCQFVTGSDPGKYVPTTSAAIYNGYIELPYAYDTNGAALGYVAEEQRTNNVLWSQTFSNAAWQTFNTGATKVGAATGVIDPFGTENAYEINVGSVGGAITASSAVFQGSLSITNGSTYTFSVWLRAKTGTVPVRISTSTALGADSSSSDITLTTTWQRYTVNATATATGANANVAIRAATAGGAVGNIYVCQAQHELGAFATSPIVTTSAAVTRAIDSATVPTSVLPFSTSVCTMFARFRPISATPTQIAAQVDDGTANERFAVGCFTGVGFSDVIDGGASQAFFSGGTISTSANNRVAAAWAANDFATSINGGTVQTDATGTLPTVRTLRFGSGSSGTFPFNGSEGLVALLPQRASNANLQAMGA